MTCQRPKKMGAIVLATNTTVTSGVSFIHFTPRPMVFMPEHVKNRAFHAKHIVSEPFRRYETGNMQFAKNERAAVTLFCNCCSIN